jgi:hypothetical protein
LRQGLLDTPAPYSLNRATDVSPRRAITARPFGLYGIPGA